MLAASTRAYRQYTPIPSLPNGDARGVFVFVNFGAPVTMKIRGKFSTSAAGRVNHRYYTSNKTEPLLGEQVRALIGVGSGHHSKTVAAEVLNHTCNRPRGKESGALRCNSKVLLTSYTVYGA